MCDSCYFTDDLFCGGLQWYVLPIFLISFFIGTCGVDHCVLSGCTCPGVCIGIVKGLTAGGLGIWYLIDMITIAANQQQFNNYYGYSGNHSVCSNIWLKSA